MSAKMEHLARFRVEYYQVARSIGGKVSSGFYRRKAAAKGVDLLPLSIFAPHFQA
jgi:hypothetical protein